MALDSKNQPLFRGVSSGSLQNVLRVLRSHFRLKVNDEALYLRQNQILVNFESFRKQWNKMAQIYLWSGIDFLFCISKDTDCHFSPLMSSPHLVCLYGSGIKVHTDTGLLQVRVIVSGVREFQMFISKLSSKSVFSCSLKC